MEILQQIVKELFHYKNGELFYRVNSLNNKFKPGYKAGCLNGNYFCVKIKGKKYLLHRIIFLWHKGYLPEFIDHIDLNKTNNCIENLREADKSENNCNSSSRKNSASIYKGVSPAHKGKWKVRINVNNKQYNIGTFVSEIEAALSYNKAAIIHHGDFANLNIIKLCS